MVISMPSVNVRVSEQAYQKITEVADKTGRSKQEIINHAVEEYRRKLFLLEANQAYAALKNNSAAWQDERRERELWDSTLEDGLERES